MKTSLHIIGAGLAGSEAAWQAAKRGIPVTLHEMRPVKSTEAHTTGGFAEMVCSNSLRSDDCFYNAVGLMHEEMRRCGSLVMEAAEACKVPAGGALAVDRDAFSAFVTKRLEVHPLITIVREEVTSLENRQPTIVAAGPLASSALSQVIQNLTGEEGLHFFDAIAPIVVKDSIDLSKAWFQSRYDKGDGSDYINCGMNKDQYLAFIEALKTGEKTEFHSWERTPYFEGCLPIEVMAQRGEDTLRYGPMKPVGLTNSNTGERPYAVVQLRQDNALGTLWNIVGFQTKLKHGEQTRIFRMIPGLENAEFARLGGIHRNTFINSPSLLDGELRLKSAPHLRFAGQITGCEGYVESAATGLMAGLFAVAEITGKPLAPPPPETALGAMLHHVTSGARDETFQPMNVNFGLFPPLSQRVRGRESKKAMAERALESLKTWLESQNMAI